MTRLSEKLEAAMKAGTRRIKWALAAVILWLPACALQYRIGHEAASFTAFLVIMFSSWRAWSIVMDNAQRATIIAALREKGE